MDYIALNYQEPQPFPRRPGIRYYRPSKPDLIVDEANPKQILVNVVIDQQPQTNLEQEDLSEPLAQSDLEILKPKQYLVQIQNQTIDFASEGIYPVALTDLDKEWLESAQEYFVNAIQDGQRIGSAKDFTSLEILEALWATAEQVGIDPKRFIIQIYNESRFDPYVVGAAGERGIGQFKESTAKYKRYNWSKICSGLDSYAYQAKIAAEFVKSVGEMAYNGGGDQGHKYRQRISSKLDSINSIFEN